MKLFLPVVFLSIFVSLSVFVEQTMAQDVTMVPGPTQKAGKYAVTLRLPEKGLVAEEEQQLEFRIVDTSREDPVQGPAPIIRAVVQARVSMPAMPSMPNLEEIAHTEGVPGDYGLHPTFAHGGEFVLTLNIKPPVGEAFTVEFPLKVADPSDAPNRKPGPKPFRLELKTDPSKVKAGEPVRIRLQVWSTRETRDAEGKPTGKRENVQVKAFDVMHEKQLHQIIVRKDLGFFAHVHPELQSDGTFVLSDFIFPTGGEYQVFADTAPKGAGGQVLLSSIKVEGKNTVERKPLAPEFQIREVVADGIKVIKKDGSEIPARKTSLITFGLQNAVTGEPITDLQPYLGAMGHLIMIQEDAQIFVHSHPDERDPQNGRQGNLTFMVRPPKAGFYRGWFEFQRNGKLSRAEFVFKAINDAKE